jgi:dCTP deaminase
LIDGGYIAGVTKFKKAADYSSIDLTLSDEGYRMKEGCIKPIGDPSKPYLRHLQNHTLSERLSKKSGGSFELRSQECYVFKLKESISGKLRDSNIYGMATAKSSVGRVDVIARLIIDGMRQYEYLDPSDLKYPTGEMFLEIIPISFNVWVKPGIHLSQLRLFYGRPEQSLIEDPNFIEHILIRKEGRSDDYGKDYLTVDLTKTEVGGLHVTAFCARNSGGKEYIRLWKGNPRPNPCHHWCFKESDSKKRFVLKSGNFYILRSRERLALPSRVAVYARPMDETLGEMRIHYAGFAHPYFGMDRIHGEGTPLIFEVRAHNVDVNLDHGERLAKLRFYRMSKEPKKEKREPSYNDQELKLSNFFDEWPQKLRYKDAEKGIVDPDIA